MGSEDLAREIENRTGLNVNVTLTDNYRSMVSVRPRRNSLDVRLHHMFAEAGEETLEALAHYVQTGDRGLETIRAYVRRNTEKINCRPRRTILRPRGQHFDLERIRDAVMREHFSGQPAPHITWGRTTRGKNRRSIQFASYDATRDLIRVNPKLDASFTPRYFLRFLVFHEILHRQIPPEPGNVHSQEFSDRLAKFPDYERARRWENENLDRFIKSAE